MKKSTAACLVAVTLLVLAAFAVRAASLDVQSLWRDEVDALRFATAPRAQMLSNFTRPGWNGPLYFLLLRGWIALAGTSEYSMRFLSLLFGVLCVPLVYALGRRLFDRPTGLLAALLVSASPYLAWYGQEVKMYTLVVALALTAIYGLRRAIEGAGRWWWAVPVVATSLAFYAHILAALLIPVQMLAYVAWWPRARRQWIGALISLACLTLPYLPLAVWQVPMVLQIRETGFHPYALNEMVEILLNGWSTGILAWGSPWGTVLMGALAIWGLVLPLPPVDRGKVSRCFPSYCKGRGKKEELRSRLALMGWLLIPLLAVWLVSLRQPLFTDRYLIWAAPPFYLLISLGLTSLYRLAGWGPAPTADRPSPRWVPVRLLGRTLRRAAALLLTGAILPLDGANLWRQATIPVKSDFRAAAAYVANYHVSAEPDASQASDEQFAFTQYLPLVIRGFDELIVFQIPYARYTFDYYFPIETYPWAEGLYTNHRTADGSYIISEQQAARRLQQMTAGHNVVWLVATEMDMWDKRGLVQAWLDANARRVDEAHFTRVDVYRYERNVIRDP